MTRYTATVARESREPRQLRLIHPGQDTRPQNRDTEFYLNHAIDQLAARGYRGAAEAFKQAIRKSLSEGKAKAALAIAETAERLFGQEILALENHADSLLYGRQAPYLSPSQCLVWAARSPNRRELKEANLVIGKVAEARAQETYFRREKEVLGNP